MDYRSDDTPVKRQKKPTEAERLKIGRFLRFLRRERNETQSDVAQALGVPDANISVWESGRRFPEKYAQKLALHFGVSIDDIYAGERTLPGGVAVKSSHLRKFFTEDEISALSDDQKHFLAGVLMTSSVEKEDAKIVYSLLFREKVKRK